jgi:hypothetical protein
VSHPRCSLRASGFGSIGVPLCGKAAALVRKVSREVLDELLDRHMILTLAPPKWHPIKQPRVAVGGGTVWAAGDGYRSPRLRAARSRPRPQGKLLHPQQQRRTPLLQARARPEAYRQRQRFPPASSRPKRFHGSVKLDPTRVGRDAGRVGDEVVAHLAGLVGSDVQVTLEIHAEIPQGAPEKVVRTVTENCQTLKFSEHGFEES